MDELDLEEAAAIVQIIDETIQTLYNQLEHEVEAGQEIWAKCLSLPLHWKA
ncbi:hypothetical protein PO124_09725 [Bacillus licheniformis]|nr:hypothetical protein [Bacillus licheniformis]